MRHFPVIVIGRGPAGLSCAIYLCRNGVRPLVIGHTPPMVGYTIENYFGFPGKVSGREIFDRGERQATALGATILDTSVIGLEKTPHFAVSTSDEEFTCEAIVLAVGALEVTSEPVPGIRRLEGKGVSRCAVCDGYTFRGSGVVVLGAADYAAHEALVLARVGAKVVMVSGGVAWDICPKLAVEIREAGVALVDDHVVSVEGRFAVEGVTLERGGLLPCEGVFIAVEEPRASDLGRKLGVGMTADGFIKTDPRSGATSVPGVYAAGDCTGGMRQISVAIGQGAIAGVSASTYAMTEK